MIASHLASPPPSDALTFLDVLKVAVQVVVAAALAFGANRFIEASKAQREHGAKIAAEARDVVREIVETGSSYWSSGIATETKVADEARIRLLEADLREVVNLLQEEVRFADMSKIRSLEGDLIASLTGGNFEARVDRRRRSALLDIDRARSIAAVGARLRAEISRCWKRHISLRRNRWIRLGAN